VQLLEDAVAQLIEHVERLHAEPADSDAVGAALEQGPDQDATLTDWLTYRGLPSTASIRDLVVHERSQVALTWAFKAERWERRAEALTDELDNADTDLQALVATIGALREEQELTTAHRATAVELRQILADLDNDPMSGYLQPTTRERLLRLVERAYRDGDPETSASSTDREATYEAMRQATIFKASLIPESVAEATTSGLDPEQEFRLYGLGEAIRHLAATKQLPKWISRGGMLQVPRVVLDLADHYAGYIRRGQL
jgi:hypothetical protein